MICLKNLKCPICGTTFSENSNSLFCKNNHSFDVAKSGYVNLLLVNKKGSKDPGDSREMIKARKKILELGYYSPIISKIIAIINSITKDLPGANILDAGCGEGYYLEKIKHQFYKKKNVNFLGIDISKSAIQEAARRSKEICWCIASLYSLPVLDNSQDIILNIFSPCYFKELLRILKKESFIIIVIPNKDHLTEVRKIVYEEEKEYTADKRLLNKLYQHPCLKIINVEEIKYSVHLTSRDAIKNLLRMTPFYWKSNKNTKRKMENKESLQVTVSVKLFFLKKQLKI